MDRFALKLFFHELLELSYNDLRPGWGNPCSYLLEVMCIRQDPFLDSIERDFTNHSHEIRLNNSGLKMHWSVDKETRKFTCYISGDQAKEYPFFVVQARNLIKKYQFDRRRSNA
ncbi:MAG: hypothetical protein DRI97_04620 [Bacteroidetes bacterium]|nr:MAG: hypothetical protein DRI97_04620 [Bacteroidota bacterium]